METTFAQPPGEGTKSMSTRRRAGSNTPGTQRKSKLSEHVATEIEKHIISLGWPVGAMLGSEAELTQQFNTSRWTLREAIGIVERDGLVEMRRGRKGGLVIAAPASEAIGGAIRNYLEFSGVTAKEIYFARRELEEFMTRRASEHLTLAQANALRALAIEGTSGTDDRMALCAIGIMRKLLEAADNAALTIFTHALSQLTISTSWRWANPRANFPEIVHDLLHYRREQIEAIIAGDLPRAFEMQTAHLRRSYETVSEAPLTHLSPMLSLRERALRWYSGHIGVEKKLKRPQLLAHQIQDDILAMGWPVGAHMGSEAELLKKYKVSRSVFREAIRSLERLGVVEMRSGHNSGLKVAKPNPEATIRSAKVFLIYSKLSKLDARDLLSTLELAAVGLLTDLPAERASAIAKRLRRLTQMHRTLNPTEWDKHARDFLLAIADACDNQAIRLYLRILTELYNFTEWQANAKNGLSDGLAAWTNAELAMTDAVADRDGPRARRFMMERRKLMLSLCADSIADILKP